MLEKIGSFIANASTLSKGCVGADIAATVFKFFYVPTDR